MKYKVLLLSKGMDFAESDLDKFKNKRIEDSVISSTDTIEVLTSDDGSEDIDVFVGIGDKAEEARCRAQKANKPSLLCDMDCSKADLKDIDATIPYTWGLFSKNNKDKEKAFLKHFNLSFVYDDAEDIMDYIASLVFHMLEEFSYHSKNNPKIEYKKQAEFIHEFTRFYLDKMKKLVEADGFVREDIKGDFTISYIGIGPWMQTSHSVLPTDATTTS